MEQYSLSSHSSCPYYCFHSHSTISPFSLSFENFLNKFQWQCSTLHIFADTFHGCYKNGTNGTKDCRWFAGLHLLLRFIIIFLFYMANCYTITTVVLVMSIAFYMGLLAVLHPYKKHQHLKLDSVLIFGLLVWCTAFMLSLTQLDLSIMYCFAVYLILLLSGAFISLLFFIGFILYWMSKRINFRVKNLRHIVLSASSVWLLEESA